MLLDGNDLGECHSPKENLFQEISLEHSSIKGLKGDHVPLSLTIYNRSIRCLDKGKERPMCR